MAFLLTCASHGQAPEQAGSATVLARIVEVPSTARSTARFARSAGSFVGGPTTASTGETLNVYVSSSLSPARGTPQSWADFIVGLLHGPEITSLTAYIATFADVRELCGEHALGCYGSNRIVAPGETVHGVTAAQVLRHEYGHHIALHRLNPPWQAIDWGPKQWASTTGVCNRATQGTAFPGDEGDNYSLNPGEAWAETYRVLDERRSGTPEGSWGIVSSTFYPDEAALRAAELDVAQPWSAPTTAVRKIRFTATARATSTARFATPRDGALQVRVSLPRGGLHDVAVFDEERRPFATALWSGSRLKTISTTICGQRSVYLRITRKGALGRVSVTASIP